MLKYANVKGYYTVGEVLHQVYQWIEKDVENPQIILVNAYECEPRLFKGYVFNKTNTYMPTEIIDGELEDINKIVGDVEIIKDFNLFNEKSLHAPNTTYKLIQSVEEGRNHA